MTQAVILAGGKGTRLASVLGDNPKSLVNVCGEPLLARQIRLLMQHGFDNIVVLVNHKAEQIEAFVSAHDGFGAKVRIVNDGGEPRGTAGALLAVFESLAERFLVVYGDTMINVDLSRFSREHHRNGWDVSLLVHPNDHPQDSDIVELDDENRIVAFHSYPHPPDEWLPNLVNAALYMVERKALAHYVEHPTPCDFAKDLFPEMLKAGAKIGGYNSFEYVKDLGTPKRLEKVERHLRDGVVERASLSFKQRAVFLDRDGTLNIHRGYVTDVEALDLVPGAAEAVRRLNDLEYRVVMVTNQPVIARGDLTASGLRKIHAKLETLIARSGAYFDAVYICPHHPDSGFPGEVKNLKIACECRKPNPGLILRAADDLNIDLTRSWMVGDTTSDVVAAKRAGLRSILVRTGEAGEDGKYDAAPDHIVDDVLDAVRLIANSQDGER